MNNVRGLYPPLYGAPANGGGGGGGSIQVDTLPEASLEYKDKIVQYTGATTETLTNGYFYKCVEHTETEGETITVTYSWDNIDVMSAGSGGGGIALSTTETKIGTYNGVDMYGIIIPNSNLLSINLSSDSNRICETGVPAISKLLYSSLSVNTRYFGYDIMGGISYDKDGYLLWTGFTPTTLEASGIQSKELTLIYTK